MSSNRFDVIVIGVGSMGSSTCWHLAKRGVRVLGLDQYGIPHIQGSHHGMSRMVRLAYFEHPDYVRLLRRAYENWRAIEQDSGESLLNLTGGLYMGYEDGDLIRGSRLAAEQHQLDHEVLSREQAMRRFPQFEIADNMVAFFEKDAGYVRATPAVAAFARQAMKHGAQIHGCEAVQSWNADEHGVTVTTEKGKYAADRLIITSGAWTSQVLRDLKIDLTVTRQTLGWFWPSEPELFESPPMTCWAMDPNPVGQFAGVYYGFPFIAHEPGFKLARHWPSGATTPETIDRTIRPTDERELRDFLSNFIPKANGPLVSIKTCLYTNSADHHFIIDRHPSVGHDNVFLACGFSGHGFKFASVIGEVMADLGANGSTDLPIAFLGLSRFEK